MLNSSKFRTANGVLSKIIISLIILGCKHGSDGDSSIRANLSQPETTQVICNTDAVQNLGSGKVACFNYKLTAKKIHSFRLEKARCPKDSIMLKNFEPSGEIFTYYCAQQTDYQVKNVKTCEDAQTVFTKEASRFVISCSCDEQMVFDKASAEHINAQNAKNSAQIAEMDMTDKKRITVGSYQQATCVNRTSSISTSLTEELASRTVTSSSNSDSSTYRLNETEKNLLIEAEATNGEERKQAITKFYESRIKRGDDYCKLAIGVVTNSTALGRVANNWLKYQVKIVNWHRQQEILKGKSWYEFNEMVNLNIAKNHARAVTNDSFGRMGILSSNQISEYHENYFMGLGLSLRTFGGSSLGIRTSYWCNGCDSRP